MNASQSAFVFRQDHRLERAKREGFVALGWCKLEEVGNSPSWDQIKLGLVDKYLDYYGGNARAAGQAAGSIWCFAREMKEGDKVLIPDTKCFFVATISGPVEYREEWAEYDMSWCRKAKWEPEPISRDAVSNAFQMRLKSRQTIVRASDLLDELVARLSGKKLPTLVEHVSAASRDAIVHSLTQLKNPDQLERIVAALLRAQGAIATVLPKNQGKPGDYDIIAEWPPAAPGVDPFRVAVQVKQHIGVSGLEGVKQLVERFRLQPEMDRLILVTTAAEISAEAQALAVEGDVSVITQNDLADWVLSRGLEALK